MKKLALLLAFTPLVTQATTQNPYVRDHEAYASWHPLLTQVGGTIAAILLGANYFKSSRQVARLCQPAQERFAEIQRRDQEENRRKAAAREEENRRAAERERRLARWIDDPEWAREYRLVRDQNANIPEEDDKLKCSICLEQDRPLLDVHGGENGAPHYMCPQCLNADRFNQRCPECRGVVGWAIMNRVRNFYAQFGN